MRYLFMSVVFGILAFLVEYYFFRKIVKAIKTIFPAAGESKIKLAITTAAIIFNVYALFLVVDWSYSFFTGAPVYIPESAAFDYLIIYLFWLFIFLVVQADLFFLLLDFIRLVLFPLYKKYKPAFHLTEAWITFTTVAFFLIYNPLNVVHNYNTIDVDSTVYKKENLPPQLNNFRIVFISDIHADRYTDAPRLQKFINNVNNAKPDLVLIGGDLISSSPEYINEAAKYIGKIKARYGVYSCVGDHENWAFRGNPQKSINVIENALKKYGVAMVDDNQRIIDVDSSKIKITFITNTYVEHVSRTLLDSLTSDTASYGLKILLTHQPHQNVAERAAATNYDLMLAGHTHGGQITFLFPFKNLSPTMLEIKYIRGNFYFPKKQAGKMLLLVTRGLGMSLVPMRLNSTPEVSIINIER